MRSLQTPRPTGALGEGREWARGRPMRAEARAARGERQGEESCCLSPARRAQRRPVGGPPLGGAGESGKTLRSPAGREVKRVRGRQSLGFTRKP